MSIYFYYFPIISPFERAWPFILTNLNPLHPGILYAKFGWNWPSGSWEEDENVNSLQTDRQTDRQTTDDSWSEKLTWAFSSGELKIINLFFFQKAKKNSTQILQLQVNCGVSSLYEVFLDINRHACMLHLCIFLFLLYFNSMSLT